MQSSRRRATAASFFLVGAAAQILVAFVNKTGSWCHYYAEEEPDFKNTRSYRAAVWIVKKFWIDILLDVVSIVTFAIAILIVFVAFK